MPHIKDTCKLTVKIKKTAFHRHTRDNCFKVVERCTLFKPMKVKTYTYAVYIWKDRDFYLYMKSKTISKCITLMTSSGSVGIMLDQDRNLFELRPTGSTFLWP